MDKKQYLLIEDHMLSCMEDAAHDREHIYRVLYTALMIAQTEENVNTDILICACLLHDIGRKEQFADPALCHAEVGGEKAYRFLLENGYGEVFADKVRSCIVAHRFRKNHPPQSIEAKILFDADKLDASGAMGIARTLLYQGQVTTPIYHLTPEGFVSDGSMDTCPSFFHEYKFKLESLYDRFYTERGRELAWERRQAAVNYYQALLREAQQSHCAGRSVLAQLLTEE